MTKYVLAYRSTAEMSTSEEDMAAVMQAWGAWFEALGPALVDGGNPFSGHQLVASDGAVTPNGQSDPLSGYSIVHAEDIDAATTLAKGCPVLGAGGSIEVCEAIDM